MQIADIVMYTTLVISVESSVSPFCSYQRCVGSTVCAIQTRFPFLRCVPFSIGKIYSKCRFSISLHDIFWPCRRDRAFTDLIDSSEDFKSLLIVPSLLIEDGTSLVSSFVG